jgi:predicted O-methyltransferase YrrM
MAELTFSNRWFQTHVPIWKRLISELKPRKILEIGSYEGQSACWLIDNCANERPLYLHCVDTWAGGIEHQQEEGKYFANMSFVEERFRQNISISRDRAAHPVALSIHKDFSHRALARLLAKGHENSFDLVYIDGSHQAADVLSDAVMSFHLTKNDGLLIFDDYLWHAESAVEKDHFTMPKPAIDSFVNTFHRRLQVIPALSLQLYAFRRH